MAPSSIPLEEKDISEFYESLPSVKVEGIIPVFRYRSKRTGLTVCLAEIEGPVVNGYFCLATEAHDDDGLPHTLEHLIFLGSELYPYKGVLDLVANRCLASGTNAWTDVDHTCYTVVTAGAEGFLQLLPVYLDHILYPVLTDAGFITEVHHVDGAGEDAGVVYCEMQGRENTGESLTQLAVQRAMYPEPSGYRSETGGIMKNLRESTTNEKVRKYHSTFYRPENLCVIVTGQVVLLDLFRALQPFEDRILNKHVKSEFTRPWQTPIPPLKEDLNLIVPYPCDDEKNGLVFAAWRGPHCSEISSVIVALHQLLEYLTETAISPLQREFVEQADSFCTKVNYSFLENFETCFCLMFENVPKAKLGVIKERLSSVLKGIADGKELIDMKRMRTVVRRKMLAILSALEVDPHEIIAQHLIGDFLYGAGAKDLEERVNQATILRGLMDKPVEFWLDLLQNYMINNKLIVAEGSPSRQLMEDMAAAEKKRIAEQREKLGEKGLQVKEEKLAEATHQNEIPPPDDMINSIPVPNTNTIQFHSVKRSTNHYPEQADVNPHFPLSSLPLCFLLDDVRSNFIQLTMLLTTDDLSPELRLYLPLLAEVIDESPVLRDGVLISHEEIIAQLAEDTVRQGASLGINADEHGARFSCGPVAQLFQLTLRVELERYAKGVQWLRELLFCTQFTAERLKIVASKMVNSVAHMKRTGYVVAQSLMKDLRFGQGSNHHSSNMMRQHTFLSLVLLRLEANPQQVIDDLNKVRDSIVSSDNLSVYMAADVSRLAKMTSPLEPWNKFLGSSQPATNHKRCISAVKCCHCLVLPKKKCPTIGAIVGIGSEESAYLMQSAACIKSYNHPDLPAIMVLLQYLTQLEGPMWRQIRGLGLAYGFSIPVRPSDGSINLLLYKCSHVVSAYKEAKRILERHISGEEEWDESLLDSARSSLIFEIIEREKSVTGVCHESLLSYFKGVGPNYSKELLQKVSEVTVEDLRRVGPVHVSPLINEEKSRCSICCHSSKVDEVVLGFKDISRNLTIIPSLDDSFLNII